MGSSVLCPSKGEIQGISMKLLLLLLSRFSHVRLCVTPETAPTRFPRPWGSPGKNTGVGCHFLFQCMKMKSESEVTQSCPTLSDPMDCSLPGASVHGIFQATVLEWVAIAFSMKPLTTFQISLISDLGVGVSKAQWKPVWAWASHVDSAYDLLCDLRQVTASVWATDFSYQWRGTELYFWLPSREGCKKQMEGKRKGGLCWLAWLAY